MDKQSLLLKKCVPCETGEGKLSSEKIEEYSKVVPNWHILNNELVQVFNFRDFKESISFINKVAILAEEEGHHPDIYIFYNRVELKLSTHAAGGITENDFILAIKIDYLKTK